MKININLYAPSGKWKYGGTVEVDETLPLWTEAHKQNLIDSQGFVRDGTFDYYIVVVSHRDDYGTDPSKFFCQHLHQIGAFAGMRARKVGKDE